ncbi:MAG: MBL fold metallo-hydrolase [Eubacterium sp.]|nr:MBL fold metallo-hydrolase [Eubacterium sp.]
MSNYKVEQRMVGPIMENCYLIVNTDTKEALIIDPGAEAGKIKGMVDKCEAKPVAILLTHGHYDHIGAVNEIKRMYDIPVYVHETEDELLEETKTGQLRYMGITEPVEGDERLHGEPELNLAGFSIKVFHTPGHTKGGVCYYFKNEGVLFSGDTLFRGSVGRTDFPGGSMSELVHSIEDKLFTLPEDTKVYPGHEGETSIGFEKVYNPFF